MDRDFTSRRGAALILGASGGLGSAITRLFVEHGSNVAMTHRKNSEQIDALLALPTDSRLRAYQLELTDPTACEVTINAIAADFGGIHTVVYASGPLVPMVHLSMVTAEQFRAQLENDAMAFFNAVRPALPHVRAARGSIVAVTTAATTRYPARDGLSAVPKGAVEALVRGLAVEEGRFGVRANCVGPGMLTDGMAEQLMQSGDLDERALDVTRQNIPMRRFGTAKDIAEAVCFLASDRARFISGQKLDVDGAYGV